jgi:ribosomal protein L10
MVTSPAFFDDLHKDLSGFEGIYSYFQGRMVIFNTKDESFEAFGVIGDEMKRTSAVRCP